MKNLITTITLMLAFIACSNKTNTVENNVWLLDQSSHNKMVVALQANMVSHNATPTNPHNGVDFTLRTVGAQKHTGIYKHSLAGVVDEMNYNDIDRANLVKKYQSVVEKSVTKAVQTSRAGSTHSNVFYSLTAEIRRSKNNKYAKSNIHTLSDLRNKCELLNSYTCDKTFFTSAEKFATFMDKNFEIGNDLSKYNISIHFYFESGNRTEDRAYDLILHALEGYYQSKGIKTFSHNSFSHLD